VFGFLAMSWPAASTPNLEDQVIFGQGFLPLALDKSISNCRAAVLLSVYPTHFISPVPTVSGERSPIRHLGRRPMGDSNFINGETERNGVWFPEDGDAVKKNGQTDR